MNFKPLENEEQYKYTKMIIEDFEKQIDVLKTTYKETSDFVIFAETIYYAKDILEAEVQDYENRRNGDYNFIKYNIRKGEPVIVEP